MTTACDHVYVTSDGTCIHCGSDESVGLAAAVDRLNEAIDQPLVPWQLEVLRQALSARHSASTAPTRGKGVTISAHRRPRPCAEVVVLSPRAEMSEFFGHHG